jgi:hypothetical protein
MFNHVGQDVHGPRKGTLFCILDYDLIGRPAMQGRSCGAVTCMQELLQHDLR